MTLKVTCSGDNYWLNFGGFDKQATKLIKVSGIFRSTLKL
jgi:hypothetical protein